MRSALLITPMTQVVPIIDYVDYIGVDSGALKILEKNLPINFAIGDFDSISNEEFEMIQRKTIIYKYPIEKDETDSELAIKLCKEKGYDKIILYGALTGRFDHSMLNTRLIMYRYDDVVLMDESHRIRVFRPGSYEIANEYKHVSFFAIEESILSLEGFKYPLFKQRITCEDMYTTSNSILGHVAHIHLEKGKILCVESNIK